MANNIDHSLSSVMEYELFTARENMFMDPLECLVKSSGVVVFSYNHMIQFMFMLI